MGSLNFHDLGYNSWWLQHNKPCILHLFTLDLSTYRFLQTLMSRCWNILATTVALPWLHSHLFHPLRAVSAHWVTLHVWNQVLGHFTCLAWTSPTVWRRLCLFFAQVRCDLCVTQLIIACQYVLLWSLLVIISYWPCKAKPRALHDKKPTFYSQGQ